MELRDFAEQVLFATTLEAKLQAPRGITDERPGPSILTPRAPGRPEKLQFKAQGKGKGDFPGFHRLEQERERGRLLHFFANHELLATELMALVLLRFPEAPAAFRRGVLQTLKDEQEHTRWYIERMRQCGIQFGDLPVSGYFWRAVSGMQTPVDYVAGLSLTFEQANLDFARYFARGFAEVGDTDTARLLEKIYRDEIGHVAYGLKWFRRWKQPGQSDWDAFCRQLKFPLSPTRAKGFFLNVEGRRAAGLDESFIDELNVHAQSKGRTPNVFVFNPFAEAFIAHGQSFTPGRHQAQLARDLASLPQFLCRQDDVVLVPQRPSVHFLSGIRQAGFPLPEFVEVSDSELPWLRSQFVNGQPNRGPGSSSTRAPGLQELRSRKLGSLRPWAWGPDSMELLGPLFSNVTGERRAAEHCFNSAIARLYSKSWSALFLKKVLRSCVCGEECAAGTGGPGADSGAASLWLCTEQEIGGATSTFDEAMSAIQAIRARGHRKVIVKEALGLAGHNAIRLWEAEILPAQRRWIARAVEHGREVIVEPWLERELDFSVQLDRTAQGLKFCGFTGLLNDRKGQFQANWAAPNSRRCPEQVAALFPEWRDMASRVQSLYEEILLMLENELRRIDYTGPLGIDAFVYRTSEGSCRLKPVVEINPRYTMGRLLLELMKQAAPGSHGLFRLINHSMVRAKGFDDFATYADALKQDCVLRLEGEPLPKIREGMLCLNDPAKARACLAVFHVRRTFAGGAPEID